MIPNGSSVKHAQTISAMVTNSQRSAATWKIVREARANIPDLTKKGASRLLALSLPTIRKYWDLESSADLPSVRKADALQGDFTPGNHTECGHPSTSKKTAGDVSEEGVKSALIRVKPPFGELRPTKGEMTGGRSNSEGENPGLFRDRRVSLKRLPDLEDYSACGTSSGYAGVINDDPQPWPAGGKSCHVPREYQTPVRPRNGAGKRRKRKSSLVIDYHDLFTIDEILGSALRGSSLTPRLRLRTNS